MSAAHYIARQARIATEYTRFGVILAGDAIVNANADIKAGWQSGNDLRAKLDARIAEKRAARAPMPLPEVTEIDAPEVQLVQPRNRRGQFAKA
ncbi:hypothetical protein [Caldimonas sp. KR1-144]|uniref:hypothetical protein n=1 Tax=Caldimonas sp. KR1-144 TaxID=3400911 RepID=UPI003C003AC7